MTMEMMQFPWNLSNEQFQCLVKSNTIVLLTCGYY